MCSVEDARQRGRTGRENWHFATLQGEGCRGQFAGRESVRRLAGWRVLQVGNRFSFAVYRGRPFLKRRAMALEHFGWAGTGLPPPGWCSGGTRPPGLARPPQSGPCGRSRPKAT